MLKKLGKIYSNMEDSELKIDYKRFLYFIQSNKADFIKVLEYCGKRIQKYKTVVYKMEGISNEGIVSFWKEVQNIILETYYKNKELGE